jgi:hypothetical protein
MSSIEPGAPVGPVIDFPPTGPTSPAEQLPSFTTSYGSVPIYMAHFQDLASPSTEFRYLSGESWEEPLISATSWPLILRPISIDRYVDPRECRFAHGTLQFYLIDDTSHTASAEAPFLIGLQCSFYGGYLESAWSTSADLLFMGICTDIALDERGHLVTVRAPSILANRPLFNVSKSNLLADIDAVDTSLDVLDASEFEDSGVILIDRERITYGSRTDNTTFWTLGSLTRNFPPLDNAAAHTAGATVSEDFILSGNPVIIYKELLTDTLGLSFYTNTAELDGLSAHFADYEMRFEVTETIDAMTFMEDQLLRPLCAYPYVDRTGLISAKIFLPASPLVTDGSFEDADAVVQARLAGNYPNMVNDVTWHYNYDPPTGNYTAIYRLTDEDLVATYGPRTLIIRSQGLHSILTDTNLFLLSRSEAWIQRFGTQLCLMSVSTVNTKRLLNCAHDVTADFDRLIDLAGNVGFDGTAEITRSNHRFQEGRMEFQVLSYPT